MNRLGLCVLACAVGLLALLGWWTPMRAQSKDAGRDERAALQGTWAITSAKNGGTVVPCKDATAAFADDKVALTGGPVAGAGTFAIDPGKSPKWIDIEVGGKKRLGVYDRKGDDLTICLGEPGGARATGFASGKAPNVVLLVLKREPPPRVGAGLSVARTIAFRRITAFKTGAPKPGEAKNIGAAKISANGKKIAFTADGGVFVLNADGTGLKRITSEPVERAEAMIDISADGKKVAWFGNGYLHVTDADGPGDAKAKRVDVSAFRLTADGQRLIAVTLGTSEVWKYEVKGGELHDFRLTGPKEVARAIGLTKPEDIDKFGGFGRQPNMDISDDGNRIVFKCREAAVKKAYYAVTMNGDGKELRPVETVLEKDGILALVGISGDGKTVGCCTAAFGDKKSTRVNFVPLNGKRLTEYIGIPKLDHGIGSIQLTGDGGLAAIGNGLLTLATARDEKLDAIEGGLPVLNPRSLSITAKGDRACFVVDDDGHQLVRVDFDPRDLDGLPPLRNVRVSPLQPLRADGSNGVKVSADSEAKATVKATLMQHGLLAPLQGNITMENQGKKGATDDHTFILEKMSVRADAKLEPGPLTLRVVAIDPKNNAVVVDMNGLEVKK